MYGKHNKPMNRFVMYARKWRVSPGTGGGQMEGKHLSVFLPEMRLDFWDSLWQGQITSVAALERKLTVLEIPVKSNTPCCRCVLRLRHGESYLSQIWRYGKERLRVAVGNLLPKEKNGVLYGVCRLTPRHVYILACAAHGQNREALCEQVQSDIQTLMQSLEQYLDLESELKEIVPIGAMTELLRRE
jgi:hypothetical protein